MTDGDYIYDQAMAGNDTPKLELTEPLVELISERFRVLGEPMRIRLLNSLRDGDKSVGELRELTGASQQNVSKHLGILHQAGMVGREKSGNQSRYRITDPVVFELCEAVSNGVRRQLDEIDTILREAKA